MSTQYQSISGQRQRVPDLCKNQSHCCYNCEHDVIENTNIKQFKSIQLKGTGWPHTNSFSCELRWLEWTASHKWDLSAEDWFSLTHEPTIVLKASVSTGGWRMTECSPDVRTVITPICAHGPRRLSASLLKHRGSKDLLQSLRDLFGVHDNKGSPCW